MNDYQLIAAKRSIPCSEDFWLKLKKFLDGAATECIEHDDYEDPGIDFEWGDDELYAYAETWGNPDALDGSVLEVIGQILQAAGLEYWEFGYAYYADKLRSESCGGGSFRIMQSGGVMWSKVTWVEQVAAPTPRPLKEIFRELEEKEERIFRKWARDNWVEGMEISALWHPAVRDEIDRIRAEKKEQAHE